MIRDDDEHQELLEAARALALRLEYVEEDHEDNLVDLEEYDEDEATETIQGMIDEEHDLVVMFGDDVDLAIKYVELVLKEARPD